MSFNISQIINSKNQPIPVEGLGSKQIAISSSGVLTGVEARVLFQTTKSITIDNIVWATNIKGNIRLRIIVFVDGIETPLVDVLSDGSGVQGFYPEIMMENGSSYFDFMEFDTVNNKYKFKAKSPLQLVGGVKIEISNIASSASPNYAVAIRGREYA